MDKETSIEQLKHFLKEMFQFNANDLDFGIYRIYNLKRKEIEHFIDGKDANCLTPVIDLTLKGVANFEMKAELAGLEAYLKKLNQLDLLNDPEGNYEQLKLFINTNPDQDEKKVQLEALNNASKKIEITNEIKDKIYNHILGYFEMYYSNGDFGYNNRSQNLYKVPYEADYDGSDTLFHWKHKGSLYIKTGNSFNSIKFKIKHLKKEFELRIETNDDSTDEEVARNNNKDNKLKHFKFNRFDKKDVVTQIIFNLSDSSTTKSELFKRLFKDVFKSKDDLDKYLYSENTKGELKPNFNDLTDDYDKVNDGAVKGIGALRVKRSTLLTKVNKNFERGNKIEIIKEKGQERFSDNTLETIYNIDQKLNSFYIGNDSDYFIHEHLEEFLTGEKERYIKNHILSDLKSILDGKLDNTTIIIAKAFDLVSTRIIEFLSAIEEFQKKLFTMKKKVVESEYCLTIDNIDETYYAEILKNKAQLSEWESLFVVKVKTLSDLKAQPTLVLDTKFFREKDGSNPFKDKVLGEIDNLDERTNGLLINSENYQGIELLKEKYNKSITSIYIDPPYNTPHSQILYKNHFKHSSWLSLIDNTTPIAKSLMSEISSFGVAIDDYEFSNLLTYLKSRFKKHDIQIVTINHHPQGSGGKLSRTNDYLIICSPTNTPDFRGKPVDDYEEDRSFMRSGTAENNWRYGRWKSFYALLIDENTNKIVNSEDPIPLGEEYPVGNTDNGLRRVYPINSRGEERVWRSSFLTGRKKAKNGDLIITDQGAIKENIEHENKREVIFSNWTDSIFNAGTHGSELLKHMGLGENFDYPKSIHTMELALWAQTFGNENAIVLDYFGGSGTTAHAVINMNKDFGGDRKYILVEMGLHFDSATKKRTLKAIYTNNWYEGKPQNTNGSIKHIFKYNVLEQYEDVLDVIEQFAGDTPKGLPLKYLYKPELNKIQSSLDLSKPFGNQLKYGQPTKIGFVDLVDTYNYLQGYEVKSLKTYSIKKKYYKVVQTSDSLIIWRDITLKEDDSKAIIEIAEKYGEVSSIEVNYEFNMLATEKGKQLKVGKRMLTVSIIHADIFNQ